LLWKRYGFVKKTHYNKINLTATNEAMNKYTTQSKAETTKLLFFLFRFFDMGTWLHWAAASELNIALKD